MLTSAFREGSHFPHGGKFVISHLLICSLTFHVGLKPCLLPAVIAMLVAVTMATMSVLCPLMAMMMMMISMFLDLPLRQQACGLPSARSTLVLLVLSIEL